MMILKVIVIVLRYVMVRVLGSKPEEGDGFLKTPRLASLRRGSKAVGPKS
jgi:hypothetical protein